MQETAPFIPGYRLTGDAGGGPFADQWEAIQESLDRPVEIAAITAEFRGDAGKIGRFEELGRTFARIRNHCFIPVIDISRTDDGVPYIVMEKIEGTRLSDIVRPGNPLAPERAAKIALQIATALDVAWKQFGFVHRNIKPRNIILGAADSVTIVNFLAGTFAGPGLNSAQYDDGMLVGTPCYMAPEQIECRVNLDYRADIYGLGALLYQLLTGEAPFGSAASPMEVLELQKTGKITAPTDLNQSIPPAYSRLVQRMMEKNPEHRQPYWLDVAEDIQRVVAGRDIVISGGAVWTPVNSTVQDVVNVPAARSASGVKLPKKTVVSGVKRQVVIGAKKSVGVGTGGDETASVTPTAKLKPVEAPEDPAKKRVRKLKKVLRVVSFFVTLALLALVARLRLLYDEKTSASVAEPDAAVSETAETVEIPAETDDAGSSSEEPAVAGDETREPEPVAETSEPVDESADDPLVAESEKPAEEPPPPPPPPPVLSPDDRVLEDVIDDLYGTLRSQSFAETKKHALYVIKKAAEQAPSHTAKFKALYALFNETLLWEDLVGNKLVDHPGEYDLSIAGTVYHIKPTGYVAPKLVCDVKINDQWLLNRPVPLTEMKPDEMVKAVSDFSTVSDSTAQLTSYAFLLLRCGRGEDFTSFVKRRNLTVFKPFMKYAGGGN